MGMQIFKVGAPSSPGDTLTFAMAVSLVAYRNKT